MGYENNFYQQRLNNYPFQNGMMATGLKGRPVSSIEEARAIQIDFDGSLFVFPDIANKKIYTKQIGMDGSVILNMYELKPIPVITNDDFVTREEFNKIVEICRQLVGDKDKENVPATTEEKPSFNF